MSRAGKESEEVKLVLEGIWIAYMIIKDVETMLRKLRKRTRGELNFHLSLALNRVAVMRRDLYLAVRHAGIRRRRRLTYSELIEKIGVYPDDAFRSLLKLYSQVVKSSEIGLKEMLDILLPLPSRLEVLEEIIRLGSKILLQDKHRYELVVYALESVAYDIRHIIDVFNKLRSSKLTNAWSGYG